MEKRKISLILQKVVTFLVVLLIIDYTLGSAAKWIFTNQKTGKFARMTYSMKKTTAEVIIFGSSHAARHYMPDIFENELNQTCYNVGVLEARPETSNFIS